MISVQGLTEKHQEIVGEMRLICSKTVCAQRFTS